MKKEIFEALTKLENVYGKGEEFISKALLVTDMKTINHYLGV